MLGTFLGYGPGEAHQSMLGCYVAVEIGGKEKEKIGEREDEREERAKCNRKKCEGETR
jgi:hypothetical protein